MHAMLFWYYTVVRKRKTCLKLRPIASQAAKPKGEPSAPVASCLPSLFRREPVAAVEIHAILMSYIKII